jgi:hypothetical protein
MDRDADRQADRRARSVRRATALALGAALGLGWWSWSHTSSTATSDPDAGDADPAAATLAVERAADVASQPRRDVAADSATPTAAAARGSLAVRVVADDDLAPRPQVGITVAANDGRPRAASERTETSDGRGEAHFADLAPGPWQVTLDRPFATDDPVAERHAAIGATGLAGVTVDVPAGSSAALTVRVAPGFAADVRVVDSTGARVAGAEIRVWLDRGYLESPMYTLGQLAGHSDGRGEFTLRSLPRFGAIPNWVGARHPRLGASPALQLREPTAGEARAPVTTLQLRDAGARLEVRVMVADRPRAGAIARLRPMDPPDVVGSRGIVHIARELLTDGAGRATFAPLPSGRFRLEVRAPDCVPRQEVVVLSLDEHDAREVVLRTGATLRGRVQTDPAVTRERAVLMVVCEPRGGTVICDALGRFELGELPSTTATWTARCEDHASATGEVLLQTDAEAWLEVTLAPLPRLRGRITTSADVPLPGWGVRCTANEPGGAATREVATDARGEFALPLRSDVSYRLVVREASHAAALPLAGLEAVRVSDAPLHVRIAEQQRNTCWIEGTLVDSADRPAIAGQRLAVRYADAWLHAGQTLAAAQIDASTGAFRVGPLPPGPATVLFASADTVEFTVDCTLHAQRSTSLGRLVVPAGGRLQVQLEATDGAEPSRVTVQIDGDGHTDLVRIDRQTLAGSKLLRAGTYRARVFGSGFRELDQQVVIPDGGTTTLAGTLRPAVRFGVRLFMPEGERSAKLVVRDSQGQEVLATELEPGTASEDWWPFLDRGVYRAEAVGASGRVYVGQFSVIELTPRAEPLEVRVALR